MREAYLEKLCASLEVDGQDAVLICPSEELAFFMGFSPLLCERFQGLFLKRDGSMFYFCNLLTGPEWLRATEGKIPVYTWFDNEDMLAVLKNVLEREGLAGASIAVNSTAQAFHILRIAQIADVHFSAGVSLLEQARILKTEEELNALRKAAAIADAGFLATLPQIRAGMTEKQVYDILTGEMSRLGGADAGALIASGPNASFPHYSGYERTLCEGDAVIMDFGCLWEGLHSDMTRTIFIGRPSPRQRELYTLLYRAQRHAEETAAEGVPACRVDAAAREILDEQKLAYACTTRVGHGIGFMTHEAPYINALNQTPLQRGMCFSVEPGIYLAGDIGLRIEDIVIINLQGQREILNKAPKAIWSILPDGPVYEEIEG